MLDIHINADNPNETLEQIKVGIGGHIEEKWNEFTLQFNNENGRGSITFIPFDWGINLLLLQGRFNNDVNFRIEAKTFNPIRFIYNQKGHFLHRFGINNKEKTVGEFHSLIFTNKSGGTNYLHFPKGINIETSIIQIVRKDFLKKKTTKASTLNQRLHEVFIDTDHDNRFSHYGTLNLKMSDFAKKIKSLKAKGMLRVIKIEAIVYEMLSLHIQQHNKFQKGVQLPTSLTKSELKSIRSLANSIIKNPSASYTLEQLSAQSGLTQAKLQDGFKFLYNRTVTEYIRHIRLETARDLMKNADLNVSQVVYSVGFTSRSYFSKIFKEKYNITPNVYRKNVLNNQVAEFSVA